MQLSAPRTPKHTAADIGLETKYLPLDEFQTIRYVCVDYITASMDVNFVYL